MTRELTQGRRISGEQASTLESTGLREEMRGAFKAKQQKKQQQKETQQESPSSIVASRTRLFRGVIRLRGKQCVLTVFDIDDGRKEKANMQEGEQVLVEAYLPGATDGAAEQLVAPFAADALRDLSGAITAQSTAAALQLKTEPELALGLRRT